MYLGAPNSGGASAKSNKAYPIAGDSGMGNSPPCLTPLQNRVIAHNITVVKPEFTLD